MIRIKVSADDPDFAELDEAERKQLEDDATEILARELARLGRDWDSLSDEEREALTDKAFDEAWADD